LRVCVAMLNVALFCEPTTVAPLLPPTTVSTRTGRGNSYCSATTIDQKDFLIVFKNQSGRASR
jgi:hypothetical protein